MNNAEAGASCWKLCLAIFHCGATTKIKKRYLRNVIEIEGEGALLRELRLTVSHDGVTVNKKKKKMYTRNKSLCVCISGKRYWISTVEFVTNQMCSPNCWETINFEDHVTM